MSIDEIMRPIEESLDSLATKSSANVASVRQQMQVFLQDVRMDLADVLGGGSTDPNALNFVEDRVAGHSARTLLSMTESERQAVNATIIAIARAALAWGIALA